MVDSKLTCNNPNCKHKGMELDSSMFYVSNKATCKDCVKERAILNRQLPEHIQHDKERRWGINGREYYKKRLENPKRREQLNETQRTWASKPENRWKKTVQARVQRMVARGELYKPDECECCGDKGKLYGSVSDYTVSNPEEDVTFLCSLCLGKKRRK